MKGKVESLISRVKEFSGAAESDEEESPIKGLGKLRSQFSDLTLPKP